MWNYAKTAMLLGLLSGVLVAAGWWIGGPGWAAGAFVLALAMNAGSYWFSDKIVLASYRAQPLAEDEAPRLHATVERIAERAGLPKPRVFRIPTEAPNAFATGRNPRHAVVAVTDGILRLLDEEELEGVLAHELAHVGNRDILISSIAATLGGALVLLSRLAFWFGGGRDDRGNAVAGLLMMLLAPLAAALIQMAVSRSREYGADARGASWVGPDGLMRALGKLDSASRSRPLRAHANSAHLFIARPAVPRALARLFSTHPPMEERIERLRRMRREG